MRNSTRRIAAVGQNRLPVALIRTTQNDSAKTKHLKFRQDSMANLFFSYQGRINRARFWLGTLSLFALIVAIILLVATLDSKSPNEDPSTLVIIFGFFGALVFITTLYCQVCLGIKRFHDRGKSGVWVLVQFIPVIGTLWYFVETGFLRGTAGPNQFGADPLEARPF